MIHLYVTVRLHGAVVEDRLCVVRDAIRLGESSEADVPFPGADIVVRRVEDRLLVRGRWLEEGDVLSMSLGAVEVTMEVTSRLELPQKPLWSPDLRLLVATVAIALTGSWWDAMSRFVTTNPAATRQVAELLGTPEPELAATDEADRRNARIQAPEQELPVPDDEFDLDALQPDPELGTDYEALEQWPPAGFLPAGDE